MVVEPRLYGYYAAISTELAARLFVASDDVKVRGAKGMIQNRRVQRALYRDSPVDGYSLVPVGLLGRPQRIAGEDVQFALPPVEAVPFDAVPEIRWDSLRSYQLEAVEKAVSSRSGMIEMPTGSGKSRAQVVSCLLLATIGPVYYMTPGHTVVENFYEEWESLQQEWGVRFTQRLVEYDAVRAGYQLGLGDILVGPSIKLVNDGRPLNRVRTLITDEGHHWTSDTNHAALALMPDLERSISFSGTPFDGKLNPDSIRHTDYDNARIIAGSGYSIHTTLPEEISEYVDLPDVCNLMFQWTPAELKGVQNTNNWVAISRAMKRNDRRTRLIAAVVDGLCALGRTSVTPFSSKDYALAVLEASNDPRVVCWFGDGVLIHRGNNVERCSIEQVKERVNEGTYASLLTTSHVDESLNIPKINTTFLAEGKKLRRVKQRAGRAIRKGELKSTIINMYDMGQEVLRAQARYRADELTAYYKTKQYRFNHPLELVDYLASL